MASRLSVEDILTDWHLVERHNITETSRSINCG